MNKSAEIGKLSEALAHAQGAIAPAKKDTANTYFKSRYADLTAIREACRKPLSDNGLAIMQLPRLESMTVTVETVLSHASGEWISSEVSAAVDKSTPQVVGSAITYLRRYGLQAMIGIAAEDDDDGEAAEGRDAPTRQIQQAAKPEQHPNVTAAAEVLGAKIETKPAKTPPHVMALWARMVKAMGEEKAKEQLELAKKQVFGASPPPSSTWTAEDTAKVAAIAEDIAF